MPVDVRATVPADREAWGHLFTAYREFYRLEPDDAVVKTVWSWITDPQHEVRALVAVDGARVVGMAHFRAFARPSAGTTGLYLDDLFTAPDARGGGVGGALIDELVEIARAEGLSLVRWITSESNATARRLYDRVSARTPWITYEITTAAQPVA